MGSVIRETDKRATLKQHAVRVHTEQEAVEPLPANAYRIPLPAPKECTCIAALRGTAHIGGCPLYEKPQVRTMRRRRGMGSGRGQQADG